MATNPMMQAVLLFEHHQTTTPYLAQAGVRRAADMAKPKEEKKSPVEEVEEPDQGSEETDDEGNEKTEEEEENG